MITLTAPTASKQATMGADWYIAMCVYGYKIEIHKYSTHRKTLRELHKRFNTDNNEFNIHGLLTEVHSRLEGCDENSYINLEEHYGFIVLGFTPITLSDLNEKHEKLVKFVNDHSDLLEGFTLNGIGFYSGIGWDHSNYYEESEEESDEESDN